MTKSSGGTTYDDKDLDSLFKAVGLVVIQWGQAEQSLDLIVAMLYRTLGGKQLAKRLPVMLTPKLAYVQKCLSQIPELKQFRVDGEALIEQFESLSQKRHDLIHGAVASLSSEEGAFRFAKLDVRDDFHIVREFRFDPAEFSCFTKQLCDLGAAAHTLGRKLWECVDKSG